MAKVIVGKLPTRRVVVVGDGDEFPGKRSIGVGGDDTSGLGQYLQTVKYVVSLDCGGSVCIGLFQFQSRGLVIEPCGGVSVGTVGRIRSNVFFIHPESGQRDHTVGFVVGEAGRLNSGAVLGCLSAADVIGIAGRSHQGIGDAGGIVTAGQVAGGSHVACRIGDFDSTSRKVGFRGGDIASGVRVLENHARGGVGTGL